MVDITMLLSGQLSLTSGMILEINSLCLCCSFCLLVPRTWILWDLNFSHDFPMQTPVLLHAVDCLYLEKNLILLLQML